MSNKTILIITDGIGHNSSCKFNAFCNAKKPTYDYLFNNIPNSLIKTYGASVGLPDNQMGNSEVGHMILGSGRVLYQDLVKINLAIQNDTLKDNTILTNTLNISNDIHLIGLLSDGGVHSHINHIIALAKIASNNNKKVYLHLITDGRDVAYNSAKTYLKIVNEICDDKISIATISGRFYSMDRDNRWDRIQKSYKVLVQGENNTNEDIFKYIDNQYKNDIFDEFIEPVSLHNYNGLQDNDGVIFCNFRSDRARELSSALGLASFDKFKVQDIKLNIATMTQYDENLILPILFKKEAPQNTLAQIISQANLSQTHIAETEKYAHVTFFFNGGIEKEFKGEKRVLIPSPNVKTYDLQPEMSAKQITNKVLDAINNQDDFIVVNYANGDMVGHTGNYEASIKAVQTVDEQLQKVLQTATKQSYNIVLTSDHGNCEMMKDEDGNILTNHTVGDVYCFVISPKVTNIKDGGLNNIAPTILKLMDLSIPPQMDEPLY